MSWKEAIFLGLGLADILGLICVIGTVWGIKMMSSPTTAVNGNLLGAASMAGAIIVTLVSEGIVGIGILWVAMAVGTVLGYVMAIKVAMIEMPQMVALLNGFGGGSSAIVSLMTLVATVWTAGTVTFGAFEKVTAVLGLIVGGVTFSGSLVAAGKLAAKINQRPIIFERQSAINNLALIVTMVLGVSAIVSDGTGMVVYAVLVLIGSLAYGVLFTIKVGGADMPITVSLLNSFSGVAASISGFAIGNPLLIAIGAVVGASGLILTQIMCRAMNRTLGQVLAGKTTVLHPTHGQKAAAGSAGPSRPVQPSGAPAQAPPTAAEPAPAGEPNYIGIAWSAKSVIVVPGYGMALAQAQGDVKALMDRLEAGGAEVKVAIHPVAGRMPGHMNVLLAEVDVPYDKLYEMDQVNDEFAKTDLVIVVGANDVINPAANTAEGTPIYGMPILNVHEAKHVIIFNYDTKPGYAGVDNPLYEPSDKVTLLLGDAATTVRKFMGDIEATATATASAGGSAEPAESKAELVQITREARSVIVVPGYGMALAQAQGDVKALMDRLEAGGAEVKVAIHPVAGRMPGHMNVLLAEVDVPYDKLYEMDQVNDEFAQTDLAVVVGANDVINPAANTAEGTPIYGMPILNVHEAKHVIIFNYDTKPGYAGVDNPLYEPSDKVTLILGDAAKTVREFMNEVGL
ncbi:MAG TPA: NAD(P)(+) transhydrogenase (Re/Si-specific) subunit beta [Bacillota bacterium]|mgnify:CR=1 FL=1|nr:NAD(P)(+) transhydrogenase (Re/Si-specific) subunit beta [Bacillota bacterium]